MYHNENEYKILNNVIAIKFLRLYLSRSEH